MSLLLTTEDLGCQYDGVHGHDHIRGGLAEFLEVATGHDNPDTVHIQESLRGEMPDDCWDEIEALVILNARHVAKGLGLLLIDGDLVLMRLSDLDG